MAHPGETPSVSSKETRRDTPPGFEQLLIPEQEVYKTLFVKYRERAIVPDPVVFKDYDADKIEHELDFVASMEAKYANEAEPEKAPAMRRSEIAEALVWNGIENNGWLGPDAQVIVPSRYDDIQNGVDQIVEFLRDKGFDYLALSIDVAFGQKQIFSKLHKIREKLERGELASIKYFYSKEAGFIGRKEGIPHVIAGFDANTIRELSVLETKVLRLEREIKSGADHQFNIDSLGETKVHLAEHWAQVTLLSQIRAQLEVFERYARTKGQTEIADRLHGDLELILRQEEEKLQELAPTRQQRQELQEHVQNDGLYKALMLGLKDFDKI